VFEDPLSPSSVADAAAASPPAVAPPRHRAFGPRADVLAQLRRGERGQSVEQVADAVGMRPNTARYHLDALARDGLAARAAERSPRRGRPRMLYAATEPDPMGDVRSLRRLTDAFIEHLAALPGDPAARAHEADAAGRTWGEALAAARPGRSGIERIVEALPDMGHHLTLIGSPAVAIELRPCPFGDLLLVAGDSVCRLHLGLMRGLSADDPDLTVSGLRRQATASTCIVRLGGGEAGDAGQEGR